MSVRSQQGTCCRMTLKQTVVLTSHFWKQIVSDIDTMFGSYLTSVTIWGACGITHDGEDRGIEFYRFDGRDIESKNSSIGS